MKVVERGGIIDWVVSIAMLITALIALAVMTGVVYIAWVLFNNDHLLAIGLSGSIAEAWRGAVALAARSIGVTQAGLMGIPMIGVGMMIVLLATVGDVFKAAVLKLHPMPGNNVSEVVG